MKSESRAAIPNMISGPSRSMTVVTDPDLLYSEAYVIGPHKSWVVMVHGAGGSVRTWKYQLEELRAHFNVLLMDLRDHGNSQDLPLRPKRDYKFELMARDVVRLLEARGIREAHFVGVSMGTIVIRWIEHLFPDRVQSVVFAGGVFRLNLKLRMGLSLGLVATKLFSWKVLSRVMSLLVMPRRNHQKARRVFLREADRIHPQAFKKWMNIVRSIGKELKLFFSAPMSAPVLVVMGSQDHVFLPPARKYAAQYVATELKVIPKCGHVCNIEASAQFNAYALDFLLQQA